ncbi:N-methylglutamate synthase subunit B [Lampropedia hyalina DSM 16112]|jgi:glutamate synthase domain-containing protein 3|uniref:N-methylglutamate synthase subunit B n=1 Tax=Lampropedia hyalina DSM 16112 TaxID=1122156 RepID=A0A1M4T992_9BURK|nr:protein glxC [Lampropedia hyalina]SHE40817.1 N-methylglutamate synthase subunit B [Lampropedia hyalina DSM 16112]
MESLIFDLAATPLREINQFLHQEAPARSGLQVTIENPNGAHAIAAGLNAPVQVTIDGHAGYYAAGMNQHASVTITGSAGTGVAENMMSGTVHVQGFASNAAGATAQGGLLVIDGDAGLRCGISLKGADIVVGGSVGSFSAFMAQAGNLVILGNAGEALGDSLYEARIFVRGTVASLGADCEEKPLGEAERAILADLLQRAGHGDLDPASFRCYGSARTLYHFHVDNAGAY